MQTKILLFSLALIPSLLFAAPSAFKLLASAPFDPAEGCQDYWLAYGITGTYCNFVQLNDGSTFKGSYSFREILNNLVINSGDSSIQPRVASGFALPPYYGGMLPISIPKAQAFPYKEFRLQVTSIKANDGTPYTLNPKNCETTQDISALSGTNTTWCGQILTLTANPQTHTVQCVMSKTDCIN